MKPALQLLAVAAFLLAVGIAAAGLSWYLIALAWEVVT